MPNEEIALKLTEIYYQNFTGQPDPTSMVETYRIILDTLYGNYTC